MKLIKTDKEYQEAISQLEMLGDNEKLESNQNLINEFELLETLISLYEKENFLIEKGNPIEIIKLKMEYLGLKQKDLIPYVGSKGVVSDVLNKKRALSKTMIRNLSTFLGLSQEILITDYSLCINKELKRYESSKVVVPKTKGNKIITGFKFKKPILDAVNDYSRKIRERGMILNYCSN